MRDELDDRLRELAGTAGGSGRLPTAEEVRRVGTRRRRVRAGAAGVAAAAVVVGVAVGIPLLQGGAAPAPGPAATVASGGGDGPTPPPIDATPPPTVDPTPPPAVDPTPPVDGIQEPPRTGPPVDEQGPPGTDGITPRADRQVVLGAPDDGLLTIGEDGYLTSTQNGVGVATAFVFTPIAPGADRYLLKTAELAAWGEPGCLHSTGEGDEPGRGVAVVPCDTRDDTQLFRTAPTDVPGTLSVGTTDGAFWVSVDGILVSMSGDHPVGTPLTAIDRGPYEDPFD